MPQQHSSETVDAKAVKAEKKPKKNYRKLKAGHLSESVIQKAVKEFRVHKSSTDAAESMKKELPGFTGSTVSDSVLLYLLELRKPPASAQSSMPYVVRRSA